MFGRPTIAVRPASDTASDPNVEDATPALWKPYPAAWLSKVHDEAVAIIRTDEYRMLWWEELQKTKGAA